MMRKTRLSEMAAWIDGTCFLDTEISGVKVDSRLIEAGDLYVCLRGQKLDGHDFAQEAIARGAAALLCDHKLDLDIAQLIVEDTYEGLMALAEAYRNTLKAKFIAISGSNGKTSCKDMLYAIFSRKGKSIATKGNQNTEIGTCLNLFRMDDTTEYAIMEMGLDLPGEVYRMAKIVRPDAGILTSLAAMHMLSFKDIEEIAQEKMAVLRWTKNPDWAFYQGDYDEYRKLAPFGRRFGYREDNDYVVSDVRLANDGVSFTVNGVFYHSNLLGRHQASNASGVIALCQAMGIADEHIRYGLNHVFLTELRTEIYPYKNALILMDAYKSNPASAKSALEILASYDFLGARYAILGDMLELGEGSDKAHRDLLQECHDLGLSGVLCLGDAFKKASSRINVAPGFIRTYNSFDELFMAAQALFDLPCLVLIKGSRSLKLERLIVKE